MRMAELGVPQNFADDYLRRLSDEVLNGVDWGRRRYYGRGQPRA